jgi:superfamily II DNA or RNA helicase
MSIGGSPATGQTMEAFPADVRFRKPWRRYQQRVLDELKDHMEDRHLHVIAAPGSGKTVLGLEVVRRLNKPTVILAPTIAIRDQWVDRFVNLFMDPGQGPVPWISRDIRSPGFLTVSTYQGLHSAYVGKPEEGEKKTPRHGGRDALLARLQQIGVRTLVLDEAHHLRNEWWKCLADLKKHLPQPSVVALTATAPFDVSPLEWQRYIDLCGPVDAEITVPELVKEKNLCPHQDYLYMSAPLQAEQQQIREFRGEVDAFLKQLYADEEFLGALENHPCVTQPKTCVEEILDDPPFFSSIAVFINHVRGRAPADLLRVIGISPRLCPKLDTGWLEMLLDGCFYAHAKSFESHKQVLQRLQREAKRIGIVERRAVSLRSSPRIARLLIRSASKLRSVEDIVGFESRTLGDDLRMVILTDHIRRSDFPTDETDPKEPNRLGVVPIFEQLRRSMKGTVRLGILSGTLTIVPGEACGPLKTLADRMSIGIELSPLGHDKGFWEVTLPGADKHKMVGLITALFDQGGVTVLIGTTSLLGEGWDAPSINSLIMASFVGSYMLSNQMRGRAIRTQEGHPNKTANIWHLVCQDPDAKEFNEDMETLSRRFKSFVGVSFTDGSIGSGLERLGLGQPPYGKGRMDSINAAMREKAQDRARLMQEWEQALGPAGAGDMVEQVVASQLALPQSFIFHNTILAVLWQAWWWGVSVFSMLMHGAGRQSTGRSDRTTLLLIGIFAAIAALAALPKCLKALWLFLKHGSVASSMKQIGKAVLKSLIHAEQIETSHWHLKVIARRHNYGSIGCYLKGGTARERSIFLEALQEVLGPIENPRYIIVRKTPLGWLMRKDYHAVPQTLGKKKDIAEHFRKMWNWYVGPTDLVYTRTPEGRTFLLRARTHAMSQSFERRAERLRSWQ